MNVIDLYESLKGVSRVKNGELTIDGFIEEDYEELYETLLDQLQPFIGENYEFWYTKWCRSYHRQKALARHTADFYDPQYEKPLEQQTIREQLATLKFFVTRRTYSRYADKGE